MDAGLILSSLHGPLSAESGVNSEHSQVWLKIHKIKLKREMERGGDSEITFVREFDKA